MNPNWKKLLPPIKILFLFQNVLKLELTTLDMIFFKRIPFQILPKLFQSIPQNFASLFAATPPTASCSPSTSSIKSATWNRRCRSEVSREKVSFLDRKIVVVSTFEPTTSWLQVYSLTTRPWLLVIEKAVWSGYYLCKMSNNLFTFNCSFNVFQKAASEHSISKSFLRKWLGQATLFQSSWLKRSSSCHRAETTFSSRRLGINICTAIKTFQLGHFNWDISIKTFQLGHFN